LRRQIVLVVEDLQWIDAISQEFLSLLSESLPELRLLLLATYRPGHAPPWIDKSYAGQIPLRPLSQAASLRVVRPVLRQMGLASALADAIVHKAEGNPFFLEQLAFHASESAAVQAGASVPATIRDVVMARIERLPEETKRVLQLAAVIGREFSFRLLSAVWQGRGSLEAQLRDLTQFEFVYERVDAESRTYAFRHILTQEAAYAGLLDRQRRTFHAGVGSALEALFRHRIEEVAELLALHFGRSDDIDRAVDYCILAAEKTQRRWANSDALSYFETALGRLKSAPGTKANQLRRIDVVIKQGELKLALGRHAEHLAELEQIHDIVDQTNDPRRQVAWNYWTGFLQILTGGRADIAIGHCRQAAEIASAAGFHELDGFIASCLAQSYVVAGELQAAIETGEGALAIFEADGNLWWASRALWHLSSATNCRGEWASSLSYCRRALEYGTLLNDMRLKAAGLWRTGNAYIQQGDADRGIQYCDDALALAPIPFDSAAARMVRGYGLIKAGGNGQAGIAELREVVAWFQNSRLSHLCLLATMWLIEGHLALNDYVSARELADQVLNLTPSLGLFAFRGCRASADRGESRRRGSGRRQRACRARDLHT
jgi:tetratricopeptide (TPR) repeat protein